MRTEPKLGEINAFAKASGMDFYEAREHLEGRPFLKVPHYTMDCPEDWDEIEGPGPEF